MKVIQELVAYFDRRGRLSRRQIRKLLDQGLLAGDAPLNMLDLCDPVGATYYFRVTGDAERARSGAPTSTPATPPSRSAAVHAGLVKAGETAVVKVTVEQPLTQYQGSVRNGVTSHDFGRYGTAYRLAAV